MELIAALIFAVLFVLLIVFAVGGVIWFFVQEDLQTNRYIKFIESLEMEEIDYENK